MLAWEDARALVVELSKRELRSPWLFEYELEGMMEELDKRTVVVDLREVESLTMVGAATLLLLQGQALVHNCRIVFAGVRPAMRKALSRAGADHILETYVSLGKALDRLGRGPRPADRRTAPRNTRCSLQGAATPAGL